MASPTVPYAVTSVSVDAGDAAEMTLKVALAMFVAAEQGLSLLDCTLSGVGVGPRWLAQLSFVLEVSVAPVYAQASSIIGGAVQGGDPAELNQRIQAVIDTYPQKAYVAIEAAGAGAGRDYMALVLLGDVPTPPPS